MDTFEAIQTRRSVKHFDPQHRMSDAEVEQLFEAAILSPTSFNMQNWRFVHVTDPGKRAEIQAAAWGQKQITEASMLIVLCADLLAWGRDAQRYWKDAPPEVSEQMVGMLAKFYDGQDQLQRDEALRSCGIAAQTIMLSARAMGYDSCPMIGFDPSAVAKIIHMPEDHVAALIIVVGKAQEPARSRSGQLSSAEVVLRDTF